MKWFIHILLGTALLGSVQSQALGNEGAHGGAGVICTASKRNEFKGFYMLDYILMREELNDGSYPHPDAFSTMTDYNQILDWIFARIQGKLPVLAQDLAQFRTTVFLNQIGSPRRWIQTPRLPRIWDQGLGRRLESDEEVNFPSKGLPFNCRFRHILQVAVKYPEDGFTIYAYVPRRVNHLAQSGPLQVSYLVVHEWLRNFTNDAEVIRRSNRLLHSTAVEELSQAKLRCMLKEIGLFKGGADCE